MKNVQKQKYFSHVPSNDPLDWLTIEDIFIPKLCPYYHEPLLTDIKYCYDDFYYSIDRIDSTKGYIKGNVQVISRKANTMKNNASIEMLKRFANGVIEKH